MNHLNAPQYVLHQPGNTNITIPDEFCNLNEFIFYGATCEEKSVILFFGAFKNSKITRLYGNESEDPSQILNGKIKFGFQNTNNIHAEFITDMLRLRYSSAINYNDWMPILESVLKLQFVMEMYN